MFVHKRFEVQMAVDVDMMLLSWPEAGKAADEDSGFMGNRSYGDLRRLSWTEAKRVATLEGEYISRIENARDTDEEIEIVWNEIYDDGELHGLDLGVATATVALSAAGCVPFSSCNGAAFGGHHNEHYPLVAFFCRPNAVELLSQCALEASVGLSNGGDGALVLYANEIMNMVKFGGIVISKSKVFRGLPRNRRSKAIVRKSLSQQLNLL